ncbi:MULTISPECIES: molecular chaperone [unclassified Pseudomonas]|uniref:fimbrial biogenesis chaperone n=1 Tax=unclassified Pseudomonas TaxID=196821 RepID=UPI0015A1DAFF|nr:MULTISPECIES: fimbria/pilus periplasmic chaperone [unclassified Pseudomonas]NWC91848.1 fimbria/pilus periplasmic chaperone [Pseudomonas sp. IPO3779]NWD20720.1 fimbria/pilus periplasmic chaperone [Pseudomonas sp. IPO3778]
MAVIFNPAVLATSLALLLISGSLRAEIVIDRTRVVYPAPAREVTVNLKNESSGPRLVQAWIDDGDAQLAPELSDVPFSLSPPIVRMEPGQGKALRLTFNEREGAALPTDRESVFWLNVLGVPPSPEGHANTVQVAFRTRIKLFLRPKVLSTSSLEAARALKWRKLAGPEPRLGVSNPSAYYVTLSNVVLTVNGAQSSSDDPPMIAPHSAEVVLLTGADRSQDKPGIRFTTIDDNGSTQTHQAEWTSDE